ncbi:MAG: type III glutamate--ammonia ligase [Actinobacteria bacterium]|nr:type III glutamate--ammonia ligase [Actinomycetota bacterium]
MGQEDGRGATLAPESSNHGAAALAEHVPLTTPAGRQPGADLAQWEQVQQDLRRRGVEYCLSSYVDVHGVTKAKAVPVGHFVRMMKGSELFTGAAIDGLGQGPADDELSLWPDLDAITVLPWEPTVAWAPGHLHLHGQPYPMDSRNVLQRQVDRLAERGMVFNLGIETEFFLVRREGDGVVPANPKDVLPRAAYDVTGLLESLPFIDELVRHMDALGFDVHSFDHEDANGQFELDFSYADAMTMADRTTLWRLMTKSLARKHGFEATYMPKPYADRTGSGGHFNMSIADLATGANLFDDKADPRGAGVTELAYHFIGGLLAHAPAICALTAPTVNSYKRLIKSGSMTGFTWAPVYISYGANNRTHAFRIPMGGGRVECRAVDIACNPYLGAAIMIAAGLDGIDRKLDPGAPIAENMYEQSDAQLEQLGVKVLPRTLLEAVEALAADPLAEQVLGTDLRDAYCSLKEQEWWSYHNTVSAWEYDRYLEFF